MKMSDYAQQGVSCCFDRDTSWVILSPIEQQIKRKIEAVGTPLKDWGINIYRGVVTGYNEAFIIDGKTKDELIAQDPKSAEIIRPFFHFLFTQEKSLLWLLFCLIVYRASGQSEKEKIGTKYAGKPAYLF